MGLLYCVVVTYNGVKWVDKCFGSIRQAGYPIKTVVVDNGSTDGTQEKLRREYPEVELIQSKENLGFGKANNIGINKAIEEGADFVFLLNQDAYILGGTIEDLLNVFKTEPSVGIISPMHFAGDESNLDSGFYGYIKPDNTPNLLGDFIKSEVKEIYVSNFVNAAAWFIKSEVVKKIGLFHPVFDHYGEDNEYVERLKKNQFKLLIYTKLFICHDRPQLKVTKRELRKFTNKFKQRMLVGYCSGKLSRSQINIKYLKTIVANLCQLNISYSYISIKNWLDINNKINNIKSYVYHLDCDS